MSITRNEQTHLRSCWAIGHLPNLIFRSRSPLPLAMGIWDLWESTKSQTNNLGIETEHTGCSPTEATAANDKDIWEIPQNIGELKVSKLLVHPIKVSL